MTFDDLRAVRDDWDEEGAPAPNPEAIARAEAFVARLSPTERVRDIDADVLGGVAVYVERDGRLTWHSFLNDWGKQP